MSAGFDLGIPGLAPLPEIDGARARWSTLSAHLDGRPFLHSEGLSTRLGPPHVLSGELLARCRETTRRFDRFFREVFDEYWRTPARRPEFLAEPMFLPALEADRATRRALPLARLDCVLTEDGELRVIELNPVGVCVLHLRSAAYLARGLRKAGFPGDAARIDTLYDAMIASFRASLDGMEASSKPHPTVGVITLPGMHRGSRVTWRDAFGRNGWRYVEGRAGDLEPRDGGLYLRGERIDALWGDFVFYLGFQQARYQQTRFASKAGDFSSATAETARVLEDPRVLALFAERRVAHVSPPQCYLATSKHLLSWIHRDDRPITERAWLQAHVARTYASLERAEGTITREDAIARRAQLILKPCQYGGAHGVEIGHEVTDAHWRARLESTWGDPGWVLQDYHVPKRRTDGEWLSFGLYLYGGELGGVTIRSSSALVVSARNSSFTAVTLG